MFLVQIDGEQFEIDGLASLQIHEQREQCVTIPAAAQANHDPVALDDPFVKLPTPDPSVIVVEEGRYFMMGDNRDHSKDSRVWGTVRLAEIKGPAFILYWSWDFSGGWAELVNPLTWWELLTSRMRWDRIGDGVP